jgi:uncharacterized protein YbjT (DUF2867 family)
MKTAFVIGASGSVGKALIEELIKQKAFTQIISFGRSQQNLTQVTEVILEMTPELLEQAVVREALKIDQEIVGFSVLGVGANTAKLTLEQHRAVDVELNRAFAKGLKKSGKVRHLNFMSAVGADPKASTRGSGAAGFPRYARVKGESEEAVKAVGLEVVSIYRPGMIIGSIHTPWILAKIIPLFSLITPKNFLSIRTSEIAKSMIAASTNRVVKSEVYHYLEMMQLLRE